jgi:hypothetical protein
MRRRLVFAQSSGLDLHARQEAANLRLGIIERDSEALEVNGPKEVAST